MHSPDQTPRHKPAAGSILAVLAALALILILATGAAAQPFQRITAGEAATDTQDSRSVNFADVDGDGDLDLIVTNSSGQDTRLYLNDGAGLFSAATGSGLEGSGGRSDGASLGDVDGDGHLDLAVVAWYGEHNQLFLGDGAGSFTPLTEGGPVEDTGYSETCSFSDMDRDGDLDLYVTNSAGGFHNFLYLNDGTGGLTRAYPSPALTGTPSRAAAFGDVDGDGDADLLVANEDDTANELFLNLGANAWTPATGSGLEAPARTSFSASWGDVDGDGDLDLFVANAHGQPDDLYLNDGTGQFTRVEDAGVSQDSAWSIGSAFGDLDNDGDLDLLVTRGFAPSPWEQRWTNAIYLNDGTGGFSELASPALAADSGWGYGGALADWDGDGDLDIAIARWYGEAEANLLYRNELANANHWLQLQLEGAAANTAAIGATVRALTVSGEEVHWQTRVLEGQSGYCGQSLRVHFGLGSAATVDSLVVDWPAGGRTVVTDVPADQLLTLAQPPAAVPGQAGPERPTRVHLAPAHPNPFNGRTALTYELGRASNVRLTLHDLLGRRVRVLARGRAEAGRHRVQLDGDRLASGTYLLRLAVQGSETPLTRTVTLLK